MLARPTLFVGSPAVPDVPPGKPVVRTVARVDYPDEATQFERPSLPVDVLAPVGATPYIFLGSMITSLMEYSRPDVRVQLPKPISSMFASDTQPTAEYVFGYFPHDEPPRAQLKRPWVAAILADQPPDPVQDISVGADLYCERREEIRIQHPRPKFAAIAPPPPAPDSPPAPLIVLTVRQPERALQQVWEGWINTPLTLPPPPAPPPPPTYVLNVRAPERQFPQLFGFGRLATLFGDTTPPPAPVQDAATGIADTTTTINWQVVVDAGSGLGGYYVYRNGTRMNGGLLVAAGTLTLAVTGLQAGTQYAWWVTAVDNAGNESAPSNVILVTTTGGDTTWVKPVWRR